MPRRRILYIQPNSEIGGSDICLLRLVRALDRAKYEPLVLLPGDGPMAPLYREAGASVLFTPMMQLRTKPSPVYQSNYLARFWPTVRRISAVISETDCDLVHTNSLYCLYGGFAARRARKPHVWHLRELPPKLPLATAAYAGIVRSRSLRIASMTRGCAEQLFRPDRVPDSVRVLHDGIDLAEFGPNVSGKEIRKELEISENQRLVGFVGRLDPWKGLDVFLKAAAEVAKKFPEVRFVVAGDAPQGYEGYALRMRELANELNLTDRVRFVGFRYGAKDMPRLMAALDVFCHTSTSPEPFGLVLIEAMAMSRPVVAAKAGGPLEIVEDGRTGILTAPGDATALSEAVAMLLSDRDRSAAMGAAGRERVEEWFSRERFARDLDRLYDEVFESGLS